MAISTFKRYETKFMLTRTQFEALTTALQEYMIPDAYCTDGKLYTIYNIYYDTPDNQLIRHSLSKPYYKEKLRLRSYKQNAGENDKVYLEIKKKIGGIVAKRRASLTLGEARNFLENGEYPEEPSYINKQVLDEISYFLEAYRDIKPKAYIAYDRMAMFAKDDNNFRITFDTNIRTRRDDLTLSSSAYGKQLLLPDHFLMEIKIISAMPLWLAGLLSELGIYKTSFSKYGTEYKNYLHDHEYYKLKDAI